MIPKYSAQYNFSKSIYPKVFSVLKNVPNQYVYAEQYSPKLRHPGGVLNRSMDEIIGSMRKILSLLKGLSLEVVFEVKKKSPELDDILREMEVLFGHLDSFQDECFIILKGLCPPPAPDLGINTHFVYEWLKLNKFSFGAKFYSYTGNIQQHVDFFSNRLKHGNERFEGLLIRTSGIIIPGFYISGVRAQDFIEVCPKIPTNLGNKVIGFSFNKTLKILMLFFYLMCDALEKVVKRHIHETHGIQVNTSLSVVHDKNFREVIEGLCDFGDFYFPYEYKVGFVRFKNKNGVLNVTSPHGDKCPYTGLIEYAMSGHGDGFTRDFPLVYC